MPLLRRKDNRQDSGSGSGFWSRLVGRSTEDDQSRPPSRQEISLPIVHPHGSFPRPLATSSPSATRISPGIYQQQHGNVSQPVLRPRPPQDTPDLRSRTPQPPLRPHGQGYPPPHMQRFPTSQPPGPLRSHSSNSSVDLRVGPTQVHRQVAQYNGHANRPPMSLSVPHAGRQERRSPSHMRGNPISAQRSPPSYKPASPPMQFGQFERERTSPQSLRNANNTSFPTTAATQHNLRQRQSPPHQLSRPVPNGNPYQPVYPLSRPPNQSSPVRIAPQTSSMAGRLPTPQQRAPPNGPSPPTYFRARLNRNTSLRRMPTTRRQQRMSMEVPAAAFVIISDDSYVQPYDMYERDTSTRFSKTPVLRISELSDSDSDSDDVSPLPQQEDSPASSTTSLDLLGDKEWSIDFNARYANDPVAPKWYIQKPEEFPQGDPKQLCGTCRHIDTSVLYQQRGTNVAPNPEDFIRLGTLADFLIKFKGCGLCHFFMRLVAFQVATKKLGAGFTTTAMANAFFGEYLSDFDNQAIEYSLWPIQFMDSYNVPTIYLCQGPPPEPSIDLAVLARPSYLWGWRQVHSCCRAPNTGRHVNARDSLDFEWIKEQLKLCDERSVGRELYSSGLVQIRAIDVHQMCIVDLDDDDEYATLSYVWGDAKQVKLIWETESLLRRQRGLLAFWDRIPKTIQDAIILTRKIGIDYLWVDALCIMQDDRDDQSRQIKHMGNIYKTSVLTIQARCGKDADHGLPGVQPGTRNVRQMLGLAGKSLVCNTLSVADEERSVWSTRAWTLQENVLSQRKLIITDESCQWWCWHTSTVEDLHCRHKYWPIGERFKSMFFYNEGHEGLEGSKKRQSNFDTYAYLVADYSQRNMKFPGDAENAMLGIFDAIGGLFQYRYTHGLPNVEIISALLWLPIGASQRRINALTGAPFWPSWSWLGWIGHASYLWANERTTPITTFGSPLKWCKIGRNGEERWEANSPVPSSQFTRLEDDPWCWDNSRYEGNVWWSPNTIGWGDKVIQSEDHPHRLDFRTLCARFRLSGTPVPRRNIYNFQHKVWEMHVLDARGIAIGAINIPNPEKFSATQQRAFAGDGSIHEFIVLSRASINDDPRIGLDEVSKENMSDEGIADLIAYAGSSFVSPSLDVGQTTSYTQPVGGFDTRVYHEKIPYCLYNVLMIERVRGAAFRVAVGRIHITAFAQGDPTVEHICLE